jgi:hypothetical protein
MCLYIYICVHVYDEEKNDEATNPLAEKSMRYLHIYIYLYVEVFIYIYMHIHVYIL